MYVNTGEHGDPRKEVIRHGQTYFAIQTHRQEVAASSPVALVLVKTNIVAANTTGKA